MANKDGFQKYLDAGIAFTDLTRARAEELVHELVQSGEFQSDDARAKVEELIEMDPQGPRGSGGPGASRGGPPAGERGHHQSRGSGQAGGRAPRPDG